MKIKDLWNEEYEFETVTVKKNPNNEIWRIWKDDKVVFGGGNLDFSYEEAKMWAMKISKTVLGCN